MVATGFPRSATDTSASFVMELGQALLRARAEVSVICPHAPGVPVREDLLGIAVRRFRYAWPEKLQRLAYDGGIPANLAKSWLARAEVPAFLAAMTMATARWGRHADIIHAHWTASGLAAALAKPITRKPFVLTTHGSDLNVMKGRGAQLMANVAVKSAARVIAVSEQLAGELRARGVPERKICMVRYGVALERFSGLESRAARDLLGIRQEALVILFIGRLVQVKDPSAIVEAAARLKAAVPQVEFHLVGNGPEEGALKALARDLGVADRVFFQGPKPRAEIPNWLAAADLLILPSLSEGTPNVVLEAMAASRPVVATSVGGIPELVAHGSTGLLVPPRDAGALAGALQQVCTDAAMRQHLGRAGRQRLEVLGLSLEAQAANCLRIYEEVLSEG